MYCIYTSIYNRPSNVYTHLPQYTLTAANTYSTKMFTRGAPGCVCPAPPPDSKCVYCIYTSTHLLSMGSPTHTTELHQVTYRTGMCTMCAPGWLRLRDGRLVAYTHRTIKCIYMSTPSTHCIKYIQHQNVHKGCSWMRMSRPSAGLQMCILHIHIYTSTVNGFPNTYYRTASSNILY